MSLKEHNKPDIGLLSQYYSVQQFVLNQDNIESVFSQLEIFKSLNNLEEAKKVLYEILPEAKDKNHFYISGVEFDIVIKEDLLRIVADSNKRFESYEFV